jgi:hypothetical protein
VDFGELNDKAIKGLMNLSKIVSRFSLYIYIHEQLVKYLNMDVYYGSHWQRQLYGARLHEFIEREQDDECTHYGSKLEACISVVNQDQVFGVEFSNERLIVYEAKWNSKWIG